MEVKPVAYLENSSIAAIASGKHWGGPSWARQAPEGHGLEPRQPVYGQDLVNNLMERIRSLEQQNADRESLQGSVEAWKKLASSRVKRINEQNEELRTARERLEQLMKAGAAMSLEISSLKRLKKELKVDLDHFVKQRDQGLERIKADQKLLDERRDLIHQQDAKIRAMALELSRHEQTIRELRAYVNADRPYGKYTEVLRPFANFMFEELKANASKGDRPGWLAATTEQHLLELYYHAGKLQRALKDGEGDKIIEHAADVANICMMVVDVCGGLESNPDRRNPSGTLQGFGQRKMPSEGTFVLCSSNNCGTAATYALVMKGQEPVHQCDGCAAEWRKANGQDC